MTLNSFFHLIMDLQKKYNSSTRGHLRIRPSKLALLFYENVTYKEWNVLTYRNFALPAFIFFTY